MEVHNPAPAGSNRRHAFTRLELLACLAALALVTNVIAVALATSAKRGDRAACFNNLRQIGVAYAQFASEHDQQMAWRVTTAEGGNYDHPTKNNSFIQFSILSNFLASPRVLIDPAEDRPTARVATEWGYNPQGGLLHPGFKNSAVSYFLGLDGNFNTPASIFSGDRNLRHGGIGGCSSEVAPAAVLTGRIPESFVTAWTNGVHGLSGNIMLYDGSVYEVDTPGLRKLIRTQDVPESGTVKHILLPF
jgi:hypothetical protein